MSLYTQPTRAEHLANLIITNVHRATPAIEAIKHIDQLLKAETSGVDGWFDETEFGSELACLRDLLNERVREQLQESLMAVREATPGANREQITEFFRKHPNWTQPVRKPLGRVKFTIEPQGA